MQAAPEILKVRNYKAGYSVRIERHLVGDDEQPVVLKAAYTPSGSYIGNSIDAHRLIVRRGIKPEKANPNHNVCSIGFCEREQRWYGWSHRAIYGFGIGDIVKKGDCTTSSGWTSEYLAEHPEEDQSLPIGFVAHTLDDAKEMAVAFAEAVS